MLGGGMIDNERWLFGRSPSGQAFHCKSSLCCGLFPAIPNVGERDFTVLR